MNFTYKHRTFGTVGVECFLEALRSYCGGYEIYHVTVEHMKKTDHYIRRMSQANIKKERKTIAKKLLAECRRYNSRRLQYILTAPVNQHHTNQDTLQIMEGIKELAKDKRNRIQVAELAGVTNRNSGHKCNMLIVNRT